MASLNAEIAHYVTGVRALQDLLADESSVEQLGDEEAQSLMDALMKAVDECVAGAPEGTMLLIADPTARPADPTARRLWPC